MRAFHDQVNRLRRLEFTKFMFTQKTGVKISWSEGMAEPVATVTGPTETQVDAMLLVLRIFVQPRDAVSFDNMMALVATLPDSQVKEWFLDAGNKTNHYLDRNTNPGLVYNGVDPNTGQTIINEDLTNRRLIEVVLYGERAHLNPDKVAIVKGLRSWQAGSAIVDNTLHATVAEFLSSLFYLQSQNACMYEALTGTPLNIEYPVTTTASRAEGEA